MEDILNALITVLEVPGMAQLVMDSLCDVEALGFNCMVAAERTHDVTVWFFGPEVCYDL